MPNSLDMGGFAGTGLPVMRSPRGFVRIDGNAAGPLLTSYPLEVWSDGVQVLRVNSYGGFYAASRFISGMNTNFDLDFGNSAIRLGGYVQFHGGGSVSGSPTHSFDYTGKSQIASAGYFGWSSTSNANGTFDLGLYRHAAGVLIQRNGTNAQQSIMSRSWTDNSNYSWHRAAWNTSTLLLMAEGAGTGTDGSVAFNDAALATNATVGFVMIPSCAGTPSGTPADIPTGQIPMVWDSTNLKLYAYTGGAWKASAAFT